MLKFNNIYKDSVRHRHSLLTYGTADVLVQNGVMLSQFSFQNDECVINR